MKGMSYSSGLWSLAPSVYKVDFLNAISSTVVLFMMSSAISQLQLLEKDGMPASGKEKVPAPGKGV